MDLSPNLRLPYLAAAQAQKHVTHNEALRALDALSQISVLSRTETVPPTSPTNGDRYLVPTGASGFWSTQAGKLAAFQDGAWAYHVPAAGWTAWISAEATLATFDGSNWQTIGGSGGGARLARLGISTDADDTNRLSVASEATLLNNAGSGHQLKINKADAPHTASLLFQTDFSGRAEMGLSGDDDFRIKVSPNGSTWSTAMRVDRSVGNVGIKADPISTAVLRVGGKLKTDGTLFLPFAEPATWSNFWSSSALYFATPYGYLGVNGATRLGLFWNGFRATGSTWTSLGQGGGTPNAACAIELGAAGIDFSGDATAVTGVTPTNRMRMSPAGDLAIGTTTATARLHVNGTLRFQNFGAGTATFDASGNVSSSSDERLKEEIEPFTRGLSAVRSIQPIAYRWNLVSGLDTLNRYAGLSAQNLETAIPEAIGIDARGYLSLQDRPIIAALINAVRELDTLVTTLEQRLSQLEQR